MNDKYTLLVLAAGMGSRFGSLKQISDIDGRGNSILDYSLYDALNAGFNKIVFIIRKDFATLFKEKYADKFEDDIEVQFLNQELSYKCDNYSISQRVKPWGTGHAVLLSKEVIEEPFLVINADDFYGKNNYKLAIDLLKNGEVSASKIGLIAYQLKNTLSPNGSVSRAICKSDQNTLLELKEQKGIIQANDVAYFESNGEKVLMDMKAMVSMNLWLFSPLILSYFESAFEGFIKDNHKDDSAEFFIPTLINELLKNDNIKVSLYPSMDNWFGVTYKEDKTNARLIIDELIKQKVYPENLWA